MLVQPSSSGKEASGFHDTCFHNIMKCAVDIRKVVRECRVVTWHKLFPMDCGAHDEGIDRVSAIHDRGRSCRRHEIVTSEMLFSLCMQTLTLRSVPFFLYHRVQKKSFLLRSAFLTTMILFEQLNIQQKTTNNQQKPNNQTTKKQTKPNQTKPQHSKQKQQQQQTTNNKQINKLASKQTTNNINCLTQESLCLRGSYT